MSNVDQQAYWAYNTMKREDYYISHGVLGDGTCIFHLWSRSVDDLLGNVGLSSRPLASNVDRAILERAIEHLCASRPP